MLYQFIRLQWLKTIRSVSLGRKLFAGIMMTLFGVIILLNVLALGLGMKTIVQKVTGRSDVTLVINSVVIFFFLVEMMYRFFLQKMSAIELEHYLHLPIGRPKIIHFLLLRSFISPFNLIVLLLFVPVCWNTVIPVYGLGYGLIWLFTIVGVSWSVHWLMMGFKQQFGESFVGILTLFGIFIVGAGSAWYGIFNIGAWVAPFFDAALSSVYPLLAVAVFFVLSYGLAFSYYKNHAYLEELGQEEKSRVYGNDLALFNRFGLAGAIADLELKLIIRHKRSRMALILSVIFLAYGLIFYPDQVDRPGISVFSIFIGTFITGIFIMNYGQLFLSWNSAHFDFYLERDHGINELVRGKHLLFYGVSTACFLLSIPYVYFGWDILFVHTATFLFNIGISMHIIMYLALWKPKPMDVNQRSMFNYEGVGAAQFLMGIPMIGLPYLIFVPFWYFGNSLAGIVLLAVLGIIGIIFHDKFAELQIRKIRQNRYEISSSFRQEL